MVIFRKKNTATIAISSLRERSVFTDITFCFILLVTYPFSTREMKTIAYIITKNCSIIWILRYYSN